MLVRPPVRISVCLSDLTFRFFLQGAAKKTVFIYSESVPQQTVKKKKNTVYIKGTETARKKKIILVPQMVSGGLISVICEFIHEKGKYFT